MGAPVVELVLAAVVAVVVTGVVLVGGSLVQFPAFGNSNVLQALTVVGQVAAVALLALGLLGVRRDEAGQSEAGRGESGRNGASWRTRAVRVVPPAASALLVAATLGIPLAATRLYLFGVSVDQEFRTQFLGRSATSLGLPDMAYADIPSFYPSGWFWLGGRFAQLTGLPGWAAYKPWAILSLAVAAACVTALWMRLLRTDRGAVLGFVTVAALLPVGSPEPYGAVVALFAPPALLLAWHAVHPTAPRHGRGAAVAVALYLGVSACFYTLYTAVAAGTVVLMAVVSTGLTWWRGRGGQAGQENQGEQNARALQPLARLCAVGVGAGVIALVVWAPYLLARLSGRPAAPGAASHYLPDAGAALPLPWSGGGVMGLLCTGGLVWLAVRARSSRRAQALGLGVLVVYLWCAASMLLTVAGTTLLGFRTEVLLHVLLAAAGTMGALQLCELLTERRRALVPGLAVLAAALAVAHVQHIPDVLRPEIRTAYADTDGDGERADRYPPGAEAHYAEIARVIDEATGRPESQTVVTSTARGFLSFHPYLAYQAISPHYANPLGRYPERGAVIASWAEATGPDELYRRMTDTPWRAPDALVLRTSGDGYTLRQSTDTYPNDPNVTTSTVTIPASALTGPHFTVRPVGPFAVVLVH